ncbi:MAG TPA: aminotransferase class I/II-fold pyridoxal phosphate-dependent enzyme [Bacteroidetes bacterium]|nr:aminotransferase class I/II-fold pyridoxal phosphate-dependent enzyme [Bacteroidota bacterium]
MPIAEAKRLSHIKEYYFSKKLAEIAQLNKEGYDIINLGIGSPDLPPDESVLKQLEQTSAQSSAHGYQPYRGIEALRHAMSQWYLKTYNVELDPQDEILPLMGSKEGIMHISLAFLNDTDQVLVPDPGYLAYATAAKMAGATPISYPLTEPDWEPDWQYLEGLDWSRVKLWWINYPHMPTGTRTTDKKLSKILALAKEKNVLLINDNPYSLVLNEESPISLLQQEGFRDNAMELNSLSKSHNMAGWRVGMLSGSKANIDSVLKVKSNFDSGMFKGIQEASIQALSLSDEWHHERNTIYKKRRALAYEILEHLKCTYSKDQVGLFVWARVPDSTENVEEWVNEILYKARVFITPGFIFGDQGRQYIRISLCATEEKLSASLNRIKTKLSK